MEAIIFFLVISYMILLYIIPKYIMPKVRKPAMLILFIAICLGAGGIGSIFTASSIPSWYATLIKPSFSPPNWIFAPVWTILYILMGISAYLVRKSNVVKLFWVHLAVNIIWSFLFFGLKSPISGLICILVLWSLIAVLIYKFSKINKWAAYLLYPYLAWVTFATFLNYNIWILNTP